MIEYRAGRYVREKTRVYNVALPDDICECESVNGNICMAYAVVTDYDCRAGRGCRTVVRN